MKIKGSKEVYKVELRYPHSATNPHSNVKRYIYVPKETYKLVVGEEGDFFSESFLSGSSLEEPANIDEMSKF